MGRDVGSTGAFVGADVGEGVGSGVGFGVGLGVGAGAPQDVTPNSAMSTDAKLPRFVLLTVTTMVLSPMIAEYDSPPLNLATKFDSD